MSARMLPVMLSSPSLSSRLRNLWLPGSGAAQLEAAERRVLSRVRVPFLQRLVPIGDGQSINTLHIAPAAQRSQQRQQQQQTASRTAGHSGDESSSAEVPSVLPPSSSAPPLVLLHGFGAGIGLWYGNLDALSSLPAADAATASSPPSSPGSPGSTDLYALDLLGCGRSSRPSFTARSTEQAEAFFVDSLDRWRAANGIDTMCLAGHSFGGYMAAAYAMRFPHRVSRLILLSPGQSTQASQPAIAHLSLSLYSTPHSTLALWPSRLTQAAATARSMRRRLIVLFRATHSAQCADD